MVSQRDAAKKQIKDIQAAIARSTSSAEIRKLQQAVRNIQNRTPGLRGEIPRGTLFGRGKAARRRGASPEEALRIQRSQTAAQARAAATTARRRGEALAARQKVLRKEEPARQTQQALFVASRQREATEAQAAQVRRTVGQTRASQLQRAQGRPNPKITAESTQTVTRRLDPRTGRLIETVIDSPGRDIQREQARALAATPLGRARQTVGQAAQRQQTIRLREELNLLSDSPVLRRPSLPPGAAAAILGAQTLRPEIGVLPLTSTPVQQPRSPLEQAERQRLPTTREQPEQFLPAFLVGPTREAQRTTRELLAPITNIPGDIATAIDQKPRPRTQTAFDDFAEAVIKAGTPAAREIGEVFGGPPPTPQERQAASGAFPALLETAKKEPRRVVTTAIGEGILLAGTGGAFQAGKLAFESFKLRGTTKFLDDLFKQVKPPKTKIAPTPPREIPKGKDPFKLIEAEPRDIIVRDVEKFVGPKGLIQEQAIVKQTPQKGLFEIESTDPRSSKQVFAKFTGREGGQPQFDIFVFEEVGPLTKPQAVRIRGKPGDITEAGQLRFGVTETEKGIFQTVEKPSEDLLKALKSSTVKDIAELRVIKSSQITQENAPEIGRFLFGKSTPLGADELSIKPASQITLAETRSIITPGTKINPNVLEGSDFPSFFGRKQKIFKPKEDVFSFEVRQQAKDIDPFAEIKRRASKTGRPIPKDRFGIGDRPRPVTTKAEIRKTVLDDLISETPKPGQDVFGTLPFSAAKSAGIARTEPVVILSQPRQRVKPEESIIEATTPELAPPETITGPLGTQDTEITLEEITPAKQQDFSSLVQQQRTDLAPASSLIEEPITPEVVVQQPKQKVTQRQQPLSLSQPFIQQSVVPKTPGGKPFRFNFPGFGPPLGGGGGGGFFRQSRSFGRGLFFVDPGVDPERVGVISAGGLEGTISGSDIGELEEIGEELLGRAKGKKTSVLQDDIFTPTRIQRRRAQPKPQRKAPKRTTPKRKAPKKAKKRSVRTRTLKSLNIARDASRQIRL